MYKISKLKIGCFIVLFLLLGSLTPTISSLSPDTNTPETSLENTRIDLSKEDYLEREPIRINDDSDFEQMAASENWQGNGSADNPYIIQDYVINANEYGYGIYIGNTTVHFTVKNCLLHDALGDNRKYFRNSGIYLYNVTNGTLSYNLLVDNGVGIYLDNADGNILSNNTATKLINDSEPSLMALTQSQNGIYMIDSSNNFIINNTLENGNHGLRLVGSVSNNISNNALINNTRGSWIDDFSDYNAFTNNHIARNNNGLHISRSNYNILLKNNISFNNGHGLFMFVSSRNTIINNTFWQNGRSGIYLYNTIANKLDNNSMYLDGLRIHGNEIINWNTHTINTSNSFNDKPVYYWANRTDGVVPSGAGQVILANCTGVKVKNQNVSEAQSGVLLGFSNGNHISNISAWNNDRGIDVYHSNNNTIEYNDIFNSSRSINVFRSSNNKINDNLILNTQSAIFISSSKRIKLSNNTMMAGGIMIAGGTLVNWNSHYIDLNNTVNEKPVYFLKDVEGGVVPKDVGQVILANCTELSIDGQIIGENAAGILLAYSRHNTISNVTVKDSDRGIYLTDSEYNLLESNNLSNNYNGIYMARSNSNIINNNDFYNNTRGSFIVSSYDNMIYNNRFIENKFQPYDNGDNLWNKSYPIGGNYWSSHTTPDVYSGPDQNIKGSDGIVDVPKDIVGTVNKDNYPWTNPYFEAPPKISDPNIPKEASNISINTNISVFVESDNHPSEVSFFLEDIEIYNETIYENKTVDTGSLNLEYATIYEWEAHAICNKKIISVWNSSFTTEGYTLSIHAEEGGTTMPEPGIYGYPYGTEVTIDAVPDNHWVFSHWNLTDGEGKESTITVLMDSDKNITAHFKPLVFPEVEIISPEDKQMFNKNDIKIEWEPEQGTYEISHYEIRLNDDEWIYLGDVTNHTYFNLTDGWHRVELRVYDSMWFNSSAIIDLGIDITEPIVNITSPHIGEAFSTTKITVNWTGRDNTSGINYFKVRLNEGTWINKTRISSHMFFGLKEGEYIVDVVAYDNASNYALDSVNFFVDLTDPEVNILTPNKGEFLSTKDVEVRWIGDDYNTGVDYYEVKLEGENWNNKANKTLHVFTNLNEGPHKVYVRVYDLAGNYAIDNVTFHLDLTPPEIKVTSPNDDELIRESDITVNWIGSDNISGISHFDLRLNYEEWLNVGLNRSHSLTDLPDGPHKVEIRAWNIAGHHSVDYVNFSIDTVAPMLNIRYPLDDEEFTERNITIKWNATDEISGILRSEIRINGERWIEIDDGNKSFTFFNLNIGNHIVEVRTWDRAGHSSQDSVMFKIYEEEIEEDETDVSEEREKDELSTILLIAIMVGALVLMALLTLAIINAYKKPKEPIDGNWYFKE